MKVTQVACLFILAIVIGSCYRGKPSEDPPIHLNPNMDSQPKYEALEHSDFFKNGSAMRVPVPGTVARGDLRADDIYYLGKDGSGKLVEHAPVQISMPLLRRGQSRFNIYCSPCHDRTGAGQGIVIKKGFLPPPSFHIDRLRDAPDGHIFDVITNGIRNMPAYNHQIPVADRWAIVTYVRALQRSQNAALSDIPEELRSEIK
jgi:hypothetical protein